MSLAAPGHNEPYDAITQAFIFLTAGVAGVLSRAKRASLTAAEDRADRAEAELDRQVVAGPPRRSGPRSPASCTTWWPITSA